jgi:MFS family permease
MSAAVVDSIPHQEHINIKQWWKYRNIRTLNLLLAVPLLTSFTLGFDGSMFGALQASDAWQRYFDHPTGADLASLGAAPTIASFAAIAIIPFTSDRLGRRWSLFLGCLFIIFGGALQAGAATLAMYGASRAFIGFGSVWCQTSGIAWVVELAQ